MDWNVKKGDFSRMGVVKGKNWINFCIECRKESECKILLYPREDKKKSFEIAVPAEFTEGNLRAVRVMELDLSEYDYNFLIDSKVTMDFYATRIAGRETWADETRFFPDREQLRCRYTENNFSWRGERRVEIPRKDMVLYKLHVRGFTMGLPEGTEGRGTFRGLIGKLPYLKSLGVTSVELMPVYEFEELLAGEEKELLNYAKWKPKKGDLIQKPKKRLPLRTNFWGYGEGMYFAPKASYAAGDDPETELKECILQLHRRGMECILEMDFPEHVPWNRIHSVLRYWVREYHVDGFHLQGGRIPLRLLLEDPYLGRTKLFYRGFSEEDVSKEEELYPRFFVDTDEFLYPARKLLNDGGGNIWELANQMKKQNRRIGYVNYIADNNGFTLADLFSYEYKHNGENGENNADGPDWNFSSNCGVEGGTTSRNVQRIRERKIRNAAAMLFFAQGVPMLMAGDEDGNSQQGNNNAYCQDNAVGWKDWKQTKTAKETRRYMKKLISFRKEHGILRKETPMELSDSLSCGYPDLSYHEENAWISSQYLNRRAVGMMYCGKYAGETEDVYIGFNFSEFQKKLALPRQKGKRKWYLYMDTGEKNAFFTHPVEQKEAWYVLDAQCVCILIGK